MQHDILGAVIKAARIHKGLSQEQLAELIDCSPRHIMSIENESKKPGYWKLYHLIRSLNIPADTIFYPELNTIADEKSILIDEITHSLQHCDVHDLQIILAAVQAANNP